MHNGDEKKKVEVNAAKSTGLAHPLGLSQPSFLSSSRRGSLLLFSAPGIAGSAARILNKSIRIEQ